MKISNAAHARMVDEIHESMYSINTYTVNVSLPFIFSLTKVAKFNLER